MGVLPGIGGLIGGGAKNLVPLTYKGRGYTRSSSTQSLNYKALQDGVVPTAGDLVFWTWFATYSGDNRTPLTGWTKVSGNFILETGGATSTWWLLAAKVLTADDIANANTTLAFSGSPASTSGGNWIAFTPRAAISALAFAPSVVNWTTNAQMPPQLLEGSVLGDDSTVLYGGWRMKSAQPFVFDLGVPDVIEGAYLSGYGTGSLVIQSKWAVMEGGKDATVTADSGTSTRLAAGQLKIIGA